MTGSFASVATPAVFPAVDLRGGRCVRLVRGRRDAEIAYPEEPARAARRWVKAGASCLHLIDLGAALGEADSAEAILRIAAAVPVPVQAGGGIRDRERVQRFLEGGVSRVLLGTRALRDPDFLEEAVREHTSDRIVVALDCAGSRVKVAGWEEESPLAIEEALETVRARGAEHVLVTATDRDGTLSGPDLDLLHRVLETSPLRVLAAGGVGSLADARAVLELRHPRLEGVVVGRALYEGRVDLGEAVALAREFQGVPER